ncbi:MAG TPA: serine/threonine-protein kinase [Verrucomicrobiae bacterium]
MKKIWPKGMAAALWTRIRVNGRRSALIFVVTTTVASIALFSLYGDVIERLSFDLLTVVLPAKPPPEPEVEVLEMDEKSYTDLGQIYPNWDRSLHAKMLRKLKADGARMVVFDVLFADPTTPEADQDLSQAMKEHGQVAVAFITESQSGLAGMTPRFPIPLIRQAAFTNGLARPLPGKDWTVRRHFAETEVFPSLPWVAARMIDARTWEFWLSKKGNRRAPRWLRYYGNSGSIFPRRSYSDGLNQPSGFFKNKVVFIGGSPRTKAPGQEVDTFRTPFSIVNGEAAPGVEILATNFLNLVHDDWLHRVSSSSHFMVVLLVALVGGVVFPMLRPRTSLLSALGMIVICFGVAAWYFTARNIWFSWILFAGVELPVACVLANFLNRKVERPQPVPIAAPVEPAPVAGAAMAFKPTMAEQPLGGVSVPDHEVVRQVGRGAYGEVWLAKNAIGMYHAVKIIFRSKFPNEGPYEREFRGIQKFMPVSRSHPGFVHILHVGRNDAAGCFYCIMEAADDEKKGRQIDPEAYNPKSLGSELHARGRLPLGECLNIGVDLAAALGSLHEQKLIHRDIKPGNIIFVNGKPKLADIGLVTDVAEGLHKVSYLGTRGYIAPEGPGSAAGDIYSLGKVIYEASMGLDCEQFPRLPTSLVENADEHSPELLRLNEILLMACEPNPAERYQTAAELESDLRALREKLAGRMAVSQDGPAH